MDKIQQEFEDWLKSNGQLTLKEDDGEYSFQHTRFAFESWKASRAALCIELPRLWNDEQRDYRDELVDALSASGISHK